MRNYDCRAFVQYKQILNKQVLSKVGEILQRTKKKQDPVHKKNHNWTKKKSKSSKTKKSKRKESLPKCLQNRLNVILWFWLSPLLCWLIAAMRPHLLHRQYHIRVSFYSAFFLFSFCHSLDAALYLWAMCHDWFCCTGLALASINCFLHTFVLPRFRSHNQNKQMRIINIP